MMPRKAVSANIFIAISIIVLIVLTFGFIFDLPKVEMVKPSIVYDSDFKTISGLTPENRITVSLDEISPDFIDAVISVEDKNFYKHSGFDYAGILRALFANIKAGKVVAGGSTITQQTAKNLFLTNDRTFSRKFKEIFYTIQLERRYSKDEILGFYCNTIFFGHGAYGVEMAARTFFGKSAADLSLAQSALLAGLPRWPTNYDPYINPDKAKERQKVVLDRMVTEQKITLEKEKSALKETLKYKQGNYISGDAPYFIAMVKNYLIEKYGERMVYQGGLQVFTSLDLAIQKSANQAYMKEMQNKEPNLQAALVALDVDTGQIKAVIGGRNFENSNYNRIYAKRQPGSTFKPFMYSLAMEKGLTEASTFMCEEIKYTLPDGKIYTPKDYGSNPYHLKRLTVKEAVMVSDNSIAVQINNWLDPKNTAAYSERFGFTNIEPVLSLPLGSSVVSPIDLTAAYATFANQGVYCEPYFILKILDRNGRVLEENRQVKKVQVLSAEHSYLITDMLKAVIESGGTGAHLRALIKVPAAGKTGTTDSLHDAWFVGYTNKLCAAVWVGYDQDKNVNRTGGSIAGPIWANFMQAASIKVPSGNFIKPASIVLTGVCLDTGMIATEKCERTLEMAFIAGTAPQEICYHQYLNLFNDFQNNFDDTHEEEDL